MNFGYFWVFWQIFFGYTGIPLPPWLTLINGGDNNRRTLGGMAKRWLQPLDGGTNVANGGLIDNNYCSTILVL